MGKLFIGPAIVSLVGFVMVYAVSGAAAVFTVLILSVLEVTLSFDNAVVNATVLRSMTPKWQRRFLTWGMIIAVFGTRLVLPIVIVSTVLWMSPIAVTAIALFSPEQYGKLLHASEYAIGAFGGTFLFMVALKYFMDETKEAHWIKVVEKQMARWGSIEAIEIAVVLMAVLAAGFAVPEEKGTILTASIVGIIVFVFMEGITSTMQAGTKALAAGGFGAFMYLNILDSAFSLDGVVGAFAITSNLVVIAVGLGIGAYCVRTLTIYFVRSGTLSTLPYLEHGAHWAILGLAGTMILGLVIDIPEVITGMIGLFFVVAAYWTSLHERNVTHPTHHR